MRVALCLAAALLLTPTSSSTTKLEACPARVNKAIAYQAEARAAHDAWLRYLASGRATPAERAIAGGEEWHAMWIERYDFTTRVLRERCRAVE